MTPEERKDYVKYRIETAYKTNNAARLLANNGYCSGRAWKKSVSFQYFLPLSPGDRNSVLIQPQKHMPD